MRSLEGQSPSSPLSDICDPCPTARVVCVDPFFILGSLVLPLALLPDVELKWGWGPRVLFAAPGTGRVAWGGGQGDRPAGLSPPCAPAY